MTSEEADEFEKNPHFESAVRLRRWDDAAKVVNLPTPNLHHYLLMLDQATVPKMEQNLTSSIDS